MFSKILAKQLSGPSAVVGQLFLASTWNRRNAALNDMALEQLALRPDDTVLEIGFGGGYLLGRMLRVLTRGSVTGIDASQAMVDYCARRYREFIRDGRLQVQRAPAEAIPCAAGRFSRVCSVNSIFYWTDAPAALGECRRVLRVDGRLVLCFTDRKSLAGRSFARHGLTLYDGSDAVRLVEAAGFSGVRAAPAQDRYRDFWCVTGTKPA